MAWVLIGLLALAAIVMLVLDAVGEWRYHNDPEHCEWCSIQLAGWRVLLFRRYCSVCAPRMLGDAGIYGQGGGPPCSKGARAGESERHPIRTGTVSCECGWSRRQHWWLSGFTIRRVADLHHQHRVEAHPETLD